MRVWGKLISNSAVRWNALSELALSSGPRQAVGTMDSYLLVVSGVSTRRVARKLRRIRRGCCVTPPFVAVATPHRSEDTG